MEETLVFLFKECTVSLTYHFQRHFLKIFSPCVIRHTLIISIVVGISQARDCQRSVVVIDGVSRQRLPINSGPVSLGARLPVYTTVEGEALRCCLCYVFLAVVIPKASDSRSTFNSGNKNCLNFISKTSYYLLY